MGGKVVETKHPEPHVKLLDSYIMYIVVTERYRVLQYILLYDSSRSL